MSKTTHLQTVNSIIELVNPLTNEKHTISDWAYLLGVSRQSIYQRHRINPGDHLYVIYGQRKKMLLLEQYQLNKTLNQPLKTGRSVNQKHTFVFRPGFIVDGVTWTYDAFFPHCLTEPAVTDIISNDSGWQWNCENGFEASTKNQVANKVYYHLCIELGEYYTNKFK